MADQKKGAGFSLRRRRTAAPRIIHLSDLHFSDQGDQGIPVQVLCEKLDKISIGIDLSDYEVDHIVLVPGSHDVTETTEVVKSHPVPRNLGRVRIEQPFGSLVMWVLAFARPGKLNTSALAQAIEDVRHEINEALAAGRNHQVRGLKVRGWCLVIKMVVLELANTAAVVRKLIG